MAEPQSHLRFIVNPDGAAVLNIEKDTISVLNPTGAFIWQALERGEPQVSIVQTLARHAQEPADVVERDLDRFMTELRIHDLLPGD